MDDLIDRLVNRLFRSTSLLGKVLYNSLLGYFIDSLDTKDDKIKYTAKNINVINSLDRTINKKLAPNIDKVKKEAYNGLKSVVGATFRQTFKAAPSKSEFETQKILDEVLKHAGTTIDSRVDLKLVYAELKEVALSEMSSYDGISLRELRRNLETRIVDKDIVNKYFSRWTNDIYSQYQRVAANEVRKNLGLRFAVYSGGVISTTRSWCKKHNRKVFHESEIEAWRNKNWAGKRKGSGYNPFYDCGDYNCRHRWDWISDELAFAKRPELREKYG